MKNKKRILIIIGVLFFIHVGVLIGIFIFRKINNSGAVNISLNANAKIDYKTYDNDLLKMQIPKGWKLETGTNDFIHYTFLLYNPKKPEYKLFFSMKADGFLKTQEHKDFYVKYYGTSTAMGVLPVLNPTNVETFFKNFTESMEYHKDDYKFKVPVIKKFSLISSLGGNYTGGEIIRAKYVDENNNKIEGIFTATISEVPLYYMTALNVYDIIFFAAPESELSNWEEIFTYCLSTIEFSPIFITEFNKDESIILNILQIDKKPYEELSQLIDKSWAARDFKHDADIQKKKDKKLNLERVYNVDTKKVYNAKVGFMEKYDGISYASVTDEMYILPVIGVIR